MVETLWQDVRYAVRSLRHSPLFALTAIATLALGIGAMTAIFSVVHAVVLQPYPFADPARVVVVGESLEGQLSDVSGGNFNDWRTQATSFEQLAAFHFSNVNLAEGETPERVVAARARPTSSLTSSASGRFSGASTPRPRTGPAANRSSS